ncbi:MAG: putative sulfate exporter family transporter [Sphingobacteriia bacterium]|nr:putative sulfate exporter family transporter [Sphingobacteriia bacterium]
MKNNTSIHRNTKKILDRSITAREAVFILMFIFSLSPFASPPLALILGIIIAQFVGHPYFHLNHKATHLLLKVSVVGLGFGINAGTALKAGKEGILLAAVSILGTLVFGYLFGKFLKLNNKISFLISTGTAICGGSAIAAIAPVIKAEEKQISIALGTIFILNSIALIAFPFVGKQLHLSQSQFGLWCAIAIHDTSSVVGAAGKYGNEALQIATTVKLVRALWIIPVALLSGTLFKSKGSNIKIPYFIGLFIMAVALNTYVPLGQKISNYSVQISKSGLTVTLFLIGCGLSKKALASVGLKPILQGMILWILISLITLLMIRYL